MNPVRIYAGTKVEGRDQLVVFISEFQPPPNLIKAIAAAKGIAYGNLNALKELERRQPAPSRALEFHDPHGSRTTCYDYPV